MQKKFFSLFLALSTVFTLFSSSTVSKAYSLEDSSNYEYYRPYVVHGTDYWLYEQLLKGGYVEEAQQYYRDWFPQYEEEYEFLKFDDGTPMPGMQCVSGNYVIVPKDSICAKRIINGEVGDKSRLGQLDMKGDYIFYPGLGVPDSVPVTYESTPITDTTSEIQQNPELDRQVITGEITEEEADRQIITGEANTDTITGEGYTITLKSKGATITFANKSNYKAKVEGVNCSYYKLYSISGTSMNISGLITGNTYNVTVGINQDYNGTVWQYPITITAK